MIAEIKILQPKDALLIVEAFKKANWHKPISLFEGYLSEQENGERVVWVAFNENCVIGYVTVKWQSSYQSFKEKNIPEIKDLNVLPDWRDKGVGTSLLKAAEQHASQRSEWVGLGVGLYKDYGTAQKLHIKQGYVPDGQGITYQYKEIKPGSYVLLDDDLILWMVKKVML